MINTPVLISIAAVILLLVIVVSIVLLRKKEKFAANSVAGKTGTSNVLIADSTGNIQTSTDLDLSTLNIASQLGLSGNAGSLGQVITSGGSAGSPVWSSGFMKFIGYLSIPFVSGTNILPGSTIFTMTLNSLTPGKLLLVTISLPLTLWAISGKTSASYTANVGNATSQTLEMPGAIAPTAQSDNYNEWLGTGTPTLVFNINSNSTNTTQTLTLVYTGNSNSNSTVNTLASMMTKTVNGTCSVVEIQ